jgi:hypothetical protein
MDLWCHLLLPLPLNKIKTFTDMMLSPKVISVIFPSKKLKALRRGEKVGRFHGERQKQQQENKKASSLTMEQILSYLSGEDSHKKSEGNFFRLASDRRQK